MKRIWNLLAAMLLLAMICLPVCAAENTGTPLKNFAYTIAPSGNVVLTQYKGKNANVSVPDHYWIDGVLYPVMLDAHTVFRGNNTVETVTLAENIGFYNNTAATLFAQCPNLRSVTARNPDSKAVVSMEYMFAACPKLTQVDLTGWDTSNVVSMRSLFSGCTELKKIIGYEQWNTEKLKNISFLFDNTRNLQTVDLRNWDLSAVEKAGWSFQTCYAGKILLPDNIAIIGAGFLNHASKYTGSSFTLPTGVKTIGYAHTFYDFATDSFRKFLVPEGNAAFQAIDGILYTADGEKMLAIPRGKTFPEGIYQIPEGVTFLGELSFSRNYNVKKVVLPNSYHLKTVPQYDEEYITYDDIGNLNGGLNLNIAVYVYSGVVEYDVKADNPNYAAVDGVIYSKDMTTLLAVPTRYKKYLKIPEGVTVWRSEAMWQGTKAINSQMESSGVYIPASMTDIAPDQIAKINWLLENKSDFRVTISKDNPAYYLDKSGKLTQRPHLADLDIQIKAENIVYDGTPKTPEITITYKNKTLQQEKDYRVTYTDNTDAGTGWVRITALSGFYGTVERSFTIEKATPQYTAPTLLEATYGQLLTDLQLPEGFYFNNPMQWVGDTGENLFYLTYEVDDPNYCIVEEISVTVKVQPKRVDLSGKMNIPIQIWKAKAATPPIAIADGGMDIPPTEYTVSYAGNLTIGRASVTITDNPGGNFNVSATAHFWIVPDPLLVYLTILAVLTLLAFIQSVKHKKDALLAMPSQTR